PHASSKAMTTPALSTLSLHDALPISTLALRDVFQTKSEVIIMPGSGRTALEAGALSIIEPGDRVLVVGAGAFGPLMREIMDRVGDRKSTRLNSSHVSIPYAVFCLKQKTRVNRYTLYEDRVLLLRTRLVAHPPQVPVQPILGALVVVTHRVALSGPPCYSPSR